MKLIKQPPMVLSFNGMMYNYSKREMNFKELTEVQNLAAQWFPDFTFQCRERGFYPGQQA